MTEINLSKLMAAIDECGTRRDDAQAIADAKKKEWEAAEAVVHDRDIEHQALIRALALMKVDEVEAETPVEKPPAEKAPREKAAALILTDYEGNDLPETIDTLGVVYYDAFNARTLRAGLELAKQMRAKESRAASTSATPSAASMSPEAADAGAGTGQEEFPDTPDFLRRQPSNKAEAAE